MAEIRTRQMNKGAVRTIDRTADLTSRIRNVQIRTREQGQDPSQSGGETSEQMVRTAGRKTEAAAVHGTKASMAGYHKFRMKGSMSKKRAEHRMADAEVIREHASRENAFRIATDAPALARRQITGKETIKSQRRVAIIKGMKQLQERKALAKRQYQMQKQTRRAAKISRRAVMQSLRALRAAIAGSKALVAALLAGGSVAIVIILIAVLFGAAFYTFGDDSSDNYIEVSQEVEAYTPLINKYARKYDISDYVELIKAVIMQESGGKGTDPMQCSESPYNKRYSHAPNSIKDPEYSISCGVHYLADCLKQSKCKSPVDMSHIRLALQGYNYGNGYIQWAIRRDGGYTVENAIAFSDSQAKKHGWSGYGDKQYPAHVLRYYPFGSYNIGVGNTAIVRLAEQQLGNPGGRKFWSWYGFASRQDWCAIFVSWVEAQCGYIDSGTAPRFSVVSDGANWFRARHQWQGRSYKPSPGDIIFISWSGSGSLDHVGIVERCDGGTVYTIEGNRSDQVKRGTYAVGSRLITGFGVPRY